MPKLSDEITQTAFGLAYVAHDRVYTRPPAFIGSALLFLIDLAQVLRVLLQPAFGWSEATYNVVKYADIVYLASYLISMPLPRFSLFIAAVILSLAMLAAVAWSSQLLKSGDIADKNVVMILRLVVSIFCSVLFTSILNFLLIPLDCLKPNEMERSFSEELMGAGRECTPFAMPEVIGSIVGISLVPCVVVFTLAFSSLQIETHPLAYLPNATCEGNLSYWFVVFKTLATVAPFLVPYVTDLACVVVLALMAAYIFLLHIQVLPYQMHASNCLRSAGYSAITWVCVSTLGIAVVGRTNLSNDIQQTLQWILAGAIPMSAMIGVYSASERRAGIVLELERLRGDWEASVTSKTAPSKASAGGSKEGASEEDYCDGDDEDEIDAGNGRTPAQVYSLRQSKASTKKSAHSKFFNPRWEMQRAARSGQVAHTIARTLLSMRQERDLPFLAYIVTRGIDENPTSEEMVLFRLALLRFVFRDLSEASNEERRLTETLATSSREIRYTLYSFSRRATREYYSLDSHEGGGAMNLMEFDTAIQRARKEHVECLLQLKKFWHCVYSSKKKGGIAPVLDSALDSLANYDHAVIAAQEEYDGLVERYPRSIPVLQAYASFCDTVQNDAKAADRMRARIEGIQNDDFEREHGSKNHHDTELEKKVARSATTSDSDNSRDKTVRLYLTWVPNILGTELADLQKLRMYIVTMMMILLCVSATAYGVSQLWLFTRQAQEEVHLVEAAGALRAMCISSLYYSRSSLLAAISNHTDEVLSLEHKSNILAEKLQVIYYI